MTRLLSIVLNYWHRHLKATKLKLTNLFEKFICLKWVPIPNILFLTEEGRFQIY